MDPTAFATACRNLGSPAHHAEAEAALISMRSSPHAVDTALEVLRVSDDELVSFHAALLLRDAALRQYQTAGYDAEVALMQKSLDLALTKPLRGTGDALLQAFAAIFKRCFMDMSDDVKVHHMQRVTQFLANKQTKVHGLRLLLQLVWEFGLTSQSTYLGQTLDFHTKCGKSFAKLFLKPLFIFVAGAVGQFRTTEAILIALDVLDAVLSWPFEQYSTSANNFNSSAAASFLYSVPSDHRAGTLHLRNSSRRICPKREWAFLVSNDDLTRTLLGVYGRGEPSSEIRSKIRQVFISLACLSGDVFENEEVRIAHAKRMAAIGYGLCENAFHDQREFKRSVDLEEHDSWIASECLSGCVIVARALTITPCELLLKDSSLLPSLLSLTVAVSEACRLCTIRYEATFLGESLRALTSVWVLFVANVLNASQQSSASPGRGADSNLGVAPPPQVVTETRQAAFRVFESLVQTRWQTAPLSKESTEEEEDDEGEAEEMGDLASIARANIQPSLAYLCNLLRKFDESGHDTPETRAERLGFLMRLAADVLADPDEGEVPLIPRTVLEYSHACAQMQGEEDLVVTTSMLLWSIMERETGRLELVSPLLSENLLIAMKRWTASYLLPPPSLYADRKGVFRGQETPAQHAIGELEACETYASPYKSVKTLPSSLKMNFADPEKGVTILNFLVRSACIHLAAFGGEASVGTAAIGLLETCAANKSHLKTSSGWKELCQAHIRSLSTIDWDPLQHISAAAHGELARVLSSSLSSPEDFDLLLASPFQSRLGALVTSSNKDSPQWTSDTIRVCEIFRGMAKSGYAGGELSQRSRLRAVERLHDLVSLAELRKDSVGNEAVILAVLAGFADFCESQLSFTESAHVPIVFAAAKRLVDLYAAVETRAKHTRQQGKTGGGSLSAEELEYRSGSLNKVLHMLISLSERNSLDFSAGEEVVPSGHEQDASGVVLACIDSVLPLFDADLFHVAEVVESYFDLVAGMCRTRPEHVSQLSPQLFSAVVTSLSFGCEHYDSKVQRWCFESIGSLARLHADSNGGTLAFQIQNKPSLLLDFTTKILELVVLSADMSSLDAAAGALLNLARCDQQMFARAVDWTVTKASSHRREGLLIDPSAETSRIQTLVQIMRTQFEKLFEGVKIHGADRMDRKKFAANLTSFVREVRAYVLIK